MKTSLHTPPHKSLGKLQRLWINIHLTKHTRTELVNVRSLHQQVKANTQINNHITYIIKNNHQETDHWHQKLNPNKNSKKWSIGYCICVSTVRHFMTRVLSIVIFDLCPIYDFYFC